MNQQYVTNLKSKIYLLSQENKRLRAEITGQMKINPSPVTEIISFISHQTGVTPMEMLSRTRQRDIAVARMLCMYIMRKHLNMQWTEIGKAFHRDHSTAIHAVTVIENQLSFAKSFESQVIHSYENREAEIPLQMDKIDRILHEIQSISGVHVHKIKGISRKSDVIAARFGAYYALNKIGNLNYSDIGRVFNRSHSSIIHGINAFLKASDDSDNIEYQLIKSINDISV